MNKLSENWLVIVAVSSLFFLSYGTRNAFGVYLKPLGIEYTSPRALVSATLSIYLITYATSSVIMGKLVERFGFRKVILLGVLLLGIGLTLSGRSSSIPALYISFGVVGGLSAAALYVPCITKVAGIVLSKRGLNLGLSTIGIGAGTFFFPPLSEYLLSLYGWRTAFTLTGVIVLCAGTPVVLLLIRKEAYTPHLKENDLFQKDAAVKNTHDRIELSLRESLSTPFFWEWFFMRACIVFCIFLVSSQLVPYLTDMGIDSMVAAMALGSLGVISIPGRVMFGALADRIGGRRTIFVMLTGLILSILWLAYVDSLMRLYPFIIIYGISYAALAPTFPRLLSEFAGMRNIPSILGFANLGMGIGGTMGAWAGAYIYDTLGNYYMAFVLCIVLLICACILNLLTHPLER